MNTRYSAKSAQFHFVTFGVCACISELCAAAPGTLVVELYSGMGGHLPGDVVMVEVGEAGARPELRGMVAVDVLIGQNSAELEVPLWTNLAPAQHQPTVTLKHHRTPPTMDGSTKTVRLLREMERTSVQ